MAVSLLIFAIIAGIAISYKTELIQTLQETDSRWLLAGLGCYFANYFCRAFRIRFYSQNQLSLFPDTIRITCLHGFASYFLPMRSGDLALPALLKFYHKIPMIQGSHILLRARLMDILTLGILLTTATLFSGPKLALPWHYLFLGTGIGFIGVPYVLIALIKWKTKWLAGKLRLLQGKDGKQINFPSGKELIQSLVIWFWTGCTTFCVIRSLDIPLSFLDVWFFAAVQLPLQLLPIQGLANSGNHEVGWLATFKLLGLAQLDPMTVTLTSHIILISYVLFLGILATVLPSNRKSIV